MTIAKKDLKQKVIEMGYNSKLVRYAGKGYEFTVGSRHCVAAADYDPSTGIIRMFNGSINIEDGKFYESVLGHEVQHARFQNYKRRLVDDNNAIDKRFREEEATGIPDRQKFLRANGTLRDPDDEKLYPAYTVSNILMSDYRGEDVTGKKIGKGQSLTEIDGVTPYSTAYWEKYKETKDIFDYNTAVNETLSEIRSLKIANSSKKIHERWDSIYNIINSMPMEK